MNRENIFCCFMLESGGVMHFLSERVATASVGSVEKVSAGGQRNYYVGVSMLKPFATFDAQKMGF